MNESKSLKKTKVLVGMAIFTALVVVLQEMAGMIKIGPFSPSLVLIPMVIGAAVYGVKAGAWLGLVFGVIVLAACITGTDVGGNAMWLFNPAVTAVAAGSLSGLTYRALRHKNQLLAAVAAAVVCPVVNTGLFCIGAVAVFQPLLEQWSGGTDLLSYVFLVLIGVNFLVEMGINVVLSPVVVRILHAVKAAE